MRILIASSVLAAAMLGSAPSALAQDNAPFCMRGSESGGLNCSYDTMAQCMEALSGASYTGTCIANPRLLGTTGFGEREPDERGLRPRSGGQDNPPSFPPDRRQ